MSDIFISYAREDRPAAERLAHALERHGWTVFWDRTIPAGKNWRSFVGKALEEARCVVVLWSSASLQSDWVQEEADDGRQRGILVPALIEDVQPPIGFRSIQAANLTTWDASGSTEPYLRLVGDVALLVGSLQRVKRAQLPFGGHEPHRQRTGLSEALRGSKAYEIVAMLEQWMKQRHRSRRLAAVFGVLVLAVAAAITVSQLLRSRITIPEANGELVMLFVVNEESHEVVNRLREALVALGFDARDVRTMDDSLAARPGLQNKLFYYFPEDADAARTLEVYVEGFMARNGRTVDLRSTHFVGDPDAVPGQMELWFLLPDG